MGRIVKRWIIEYHLILKTLWSMKNMTGIYYADLFEINGFGCLIMGCGKSKACRRYTGDSTKEIMTDFVRLEYSNKKLWGYGDVTMGILPSPHLTNGIEIKYLIYMDSEEETRNCNIIQISKERFCTIARFNIVFGCCDVSSREDEFQLLIEDTEVKCIEVPWCESIMIKGMLIKKFIK